MRATRPDRQTLLFSATLPQRVKHLVREALVDEVSVTVGHAGAAHADVQQEVLLMPSADAKMQWLQARTPRLVDEGQVLVFVNSRAVVDGIVTLLEVSCCHAPPLQSMSTAVVRLLRRCRSVYATPPGRVGIERY